MQWKSIRRMTRCLLHTYKFHPHIKSATEYRERSTQMSLIKTFPFFSGLYGNNGILPARNQLADTTSKTLSEKIHNKPTLLWFAPYLGLNTEYMMDVLALTGIFLSFTGFISQKFCTAPIFGALWSLYYSLYQVGQTFMWFQW